MKKNITKYREVYKPFEYPQAFEFMKMQQSAHWLPNEVPMVKDIHDWNHELTEPEKRVVGQILKSFAQQETYVGDNWSSNIAQWFPKHEIHDMAVTFAAQEAIHSEGYDYLNEELGLVDYEAFLEDPTAVAKLERLKSVKTNTLRDKARSLAIFAAFTEGVSLFSSFAVLFNFSRFNLLDGVETIVSWSILDEQLHSKAGCWLFRELIRENPQIWDDELKKEIYDAARLTVQLEDDFIDNAFSLGKIRGLKAEDLKVFIRNRCNAKLQELGLNSNWKNIDQKALKRMDWFEKSHGGLAMTDFFAKKVTEYQKSYINIGNIFTNHKNKTKFKKALDKIETKVKEEKSDDEYVKELAVHKKKNQAPKWMTAESYQILSKGYRLKGETPRGMYKRVANAAAHELFLEVKNESKTIFGMTESQLAKVFFNYMYKKAWLCPASPVLQNLGTDRGLPISCFGIDIGDNLIDIHGGVSELGAMTAASGGVGISLSRIRGKGALIQDGKRGKSGGVIPWAKTYDSTVVGVNQGSRKGAISGNLSVWHPDIEQFLKIRKPQGDPNTQCLNSHHCVTLDDKFLDLVEEGDFKARDLWAKIMKMKQETNEPYLMNLDTTNRLSPQMYHDKNLLVSMTNICTEIVLHTDPMHSFVCCLSSLNLLRYDEWKDSDLPLIAVLFLNGVMNNFIRLTGELEKKGDYRLAKARRSAVKGRPVGIGVVGWHSLLQSKMIPFESFDAMTLNNEVFKKIKVESEGASRRLISEGIFEEPEYCKGYGIYNTHLVAIAPTRTNASIVNAKSFSIEPNMGNALTDKGAKGSFFIKNTFLEEVLDGYKKNTDEVWKSIDKNNGSVQHLDFLSEHEKKVFKTAFEINQKSIIAQAYQRQKYVDQAQSVNLFFKEDVDLEFFSNVHFEAMRKLKTQYYTRTLTGIKSSSNQSHTDDDSCLSCEG